MELHRTALSADYHLLGKPILAVSGYPLKLVVEDNELHFIYSNILEQPQKFPVYEADQIFLNLIVISSLFGATCFTFEKRILKKFLFSILMLMVMHIIVIFAYAYAHIWNTVLTQPHEVQVVIISVLTRYFSQPVSVFCGKLTFHWNMWGWDVIPVFIWFLSIRRYSFISENLQKHFKPLTDIRFSNRIAGIK